MSRFLKIFGWEGKYFGRGHKPKSRWINVDSIDEIIPLHPSRYLDSEGQHVKAKQGEPADGDGYRLVSRCEIAVHAEVSHTGGRYDILHGKFIVDCDADTLVAEIEALIAPPPAPAEDDGLKLTDRGVWLPGESYVTLDLVGHPDDVSRKFVATSPSKSNGKLVLTQKKYWCEITLASA